MMTREEIVEIEQYCSGHEVGKKARHADLAYHFGTSTRRAGNIAFAEELLRLQDQVGWLQFDNAIPLSNVAGLEALAEKMSRKISEMQDTINSLRSMVAYFRRRLFGSMT